MDVFFTSTDIPSEIKHSIYFFKQLSKRALCIPLKIRQQRKIFAGWTANLRFLTKLTFKKSINITFLNMCISQEIEFV